MNVRVELLERWDRLPFTVSDDTPVATLKREALRAFGVDPSAAADFVVKLHGFEVLNEQESVSQNGARDGSTYLVMYRRRRAVR